MFFFLLWRRRSTYNKKLKEMGENKSTCMTSSKKGREKLNKKKKKKRQDIKRLPLYPLGKLSSTCVVFLSPFVVQCHNMSDNAMVLCNGDFQEMSVFIVSPDWGHEIRIIQCIIVSIALRCSPIHQIASKSSGQLSWPPHKSHRKMTLLDALNPSRMPQIIWS